MVELKLKSRDFSWFKKEHKKLSRKVEKAYIKYKKSGSADDQQKYSKLQSIYKNKCRKDRNHSWKHFVDTIRKEKEIAKLTKKLQAGSGNKLSVLEKADGTVTDPGEETITELVGTHFPYSEPIKHVKYSSINSTPTSVIKSQFSDWIDADKTKLAMADFEKKKSPGPDNLKPI